MYCYVCRSILPIPYFGHRSRLELNAFTRHWKTLEATLTPIIRERPTYVVENTVSRGIAEIISIALCILFTTVKCTKKGSWYLYITSSDIVVITIQRHITLILRKGVNSSRDKGSTKVPCGAVRVNYIFRFIPVTYDFLRIHMNF